MSLFNKFFSKEKPLPFLAEICIDKRRLEFRQKIDAMDYKESILVDNKIALLLNKSIIETHELVKKRLCQSHSKTYDDGSIRVWRLMCDCIK